MTKQETIECPICTRITPKDFWHKHHLIPRSKKGKQTLLLCDSCGKMLHQLFTNKELKNKYNTLEKLLAHEDVQNWIAWIKKKPNDFTVCMASKKKKRG